VILLNFGEVWDGRNGGVGGMVIKHVSCAGGDLVH
jgi:hypothetical protein